MIRTYFKLAFRNLFKHRFYALLNITGLFAGMLFALLVIAYVWNEWQVNKNIRHSAQQYFLQSEWKDDPDNNAITTLGPLARQLKENYPHLVANYYRWDGITSGVSKGDKAFREGIQLVDSTLLSMYGFALLHGNAADVWKDPYSVVITADAAIKYFGKTEVIGETLTIQSFSGTRKDFAITGVLKEPGKNSVLNLNEENNNQLFISAEANSFFGRTSMDDWNNISIPAYIELQPGVTVAAVNNAIDALLNTHEPSSLKNVLKVHAVALQDYYLHKDNALVQKMLLTLSFTGLFILLMAVVNFVNISIAGSGTRIREIGVRKVMGSKRSHLVLQFLAESVILSAIAVAMALIVYPAAAKLFSAMLGTELPALRTFPVLFYVIPLLLMLITGVMAGWYPAWILSSLHAVDSLKGKLKTAGEKVWLRKSLVGFQFSIALVVLILAMVVNEQVHYFFSNQIGYDKEGVIAAQVPRNWSPDGVQQMKAIRNELAALPQVRSVSLSYEIPNGNNGGDPHVYKQGTDSAAALPMHALVTDEHYLQTYNMHMVAGNFFDSREQDSAKVIINEKAALALGYKNPEEANGALLRIPNDPVVFTVKGVVKDFHFGSMKDGVQPLLFFNVYTAVVHRYLSFKLKPGNTRTAIEAIQHKWSSLMPGTAFEFVFIDDALKKIYASELQMEKAAYTSTVLSLLIALLGVTGLVSLSIRRRIKEVGIRKVLGASISQVLFLFVKDFLSILLVAAFIAIPLAYLFAKKWLENYASRIELTAVPFILCMGLLSAVTVVMIVLQSARIAVKKPVSALRTE